MMEAARQSDWLTWSGNKYWSLIGLAGSDSTIENLSSSQEHPYSETTSHLDHFLVLVFW